MDNIEEIDVNFESPAARKTFGNIKLVDQINGFAIAVKNISLYMTGKISAGGENS